MKIILISVGTRGDMEPFLAIGELLKSRGHEVICVFPEQYRYLAEDAGIPFHGLTKEFLELVEGKDGQLIMGGRGSFLKKVQGYIRLYRKSKQINYRLVDEQAEILKKENPDRVVYNGKSMFPIIWGNENPGRAILLSPIPCLVLPVSEYPHVGININLGPRLNLWSYKLLNLALIKSIMDATKNYHKQLKKKDIRAQILLGKIVYTVSRSLFKRPEHWHSNAHVLGYHERNKARNWQPTPELISFLDQHDKVLLITFGSMLNPEPELKTKLICNLLKKHQIPAIINTAAGGLVSLGEFESRKTSIHFESSLPYDWILPKVYGIIHHGGSGTTHMGLKYGCASMIVPHIIDQFLWNRIVSSHGAGPKGPSIQKLNQKTLEPKLLALWNNAQFKYKAEELAAEMKKEDYEEELVGVITS